MSKVIEVENLVKIYSNGTRAVDGISFSVDEKEIFGFLGPNGAGKSTTIKTLVGLIRPTSGVMRLGGVDIRKHPGEIKRQTGYASQETAIDDRLTGWENITLQGHYYHLPSREIAERSKEVLEIFDMYERRNDLADSYSGGMLKRLDIACALIHRPQILFLDEPTLGLDVQTRQVIWHYIEHLREEEGMTIFITTHYMEEADSLCRRLAIIDHGKIVALDTPGALKAKIGGDIVTVRFASENGKLNTLLSSIRSLPRVKKINATEEGIHRIMVEQSGDQLVPEIIRAADEQNVGVQSIRLKRPTLDDVYLHFTGHEIREEKGDREAQGKARRMKSRARR
ncbi:MAG TPA: ATP-binding cassette domain-containing protein [Candidatus Acetothermia bacterium]|nr:ATP-binding cassette domain-containing protein [Candidatus Acetothermia bacterium]HEX32235.1 ATP-binding cassette domain-containing protein [Candidatus Acetothermia bacterium]